MKEIIRRQGVEDKHESCMVTVTTLAFDIVAAVLDEALHLEVTLFEVFSA